MDRMKAEILKIKGTWRDVADAARTTIGMEPGEGEPSSAWKRKMLIAEHSPIRKLVVSWKWTDLPSWVSVHFVRHKFGIEHFVRSQRTDRTGINRDELPQRALVTHECEANAQAIINISRKRLCGKASFETRKAWRFFLDKLRKYQPELWEACVPECVYRGFCPEMESCGFVDSDSYKENLEFYRRRLK